MAQQNHIMNVQCERLCYNLADFASICRIAEPAFGDLMTHLAFESTESVECPSTQRVGMVSILQYII